jgi:hypothetical protein
MITDGKPTCLKVGKRYYKNSFAWIVRSQPVA